MPKLTISLAQMQIAPGNLRRNMDTMQALVVEAARRGSQLIVLPELWPSGYALKQNLHRRVHARAARRRHQ